MYGEYEHTIDAKGRMNFPAKLREEFGEHFYISKSLNEKCLTVYTAESWEALKESLRGKPSKIAKPIERFLIGGGSEVEPDKQGRIAIPSALRSYANITGEVVVKPHDNNFANITGEVVVVGLVDGAEIWDKAAWEEYNKGTSLEDISKLAEELGI